MPKPKTVNVQIIRRGETADELPEPYRIMDKLIGEYHPHLALAKIALAWNHAWKCDKDSKLVLGKCKKASDLDREISSLIDGEPYDFVILLNFPVWSSEDFGPLQKRALIDHELSHAAADMAEDGETQKTDSKGRLCWRIRKHDIEDFAEIVGRYGFYHQALEKFVRSCVKKEQGKFGKQLKLHEASPAMPDAEVAPMVNAPTEETEVQA
jgi:hypothetical protein